MHQFLYVDASTSALSLLFLIKKTKKILKTIHTQTFKT